MDLSAIRLRNVFINVSISQSLNRNLRDFIYYNIRNNIVIFIITAQEDIPRDPCQPSPCGPNSQCRVSNGQSICSCLPEYNGSPPNCRPECVVSAECPVDKICKNQKCISPCPGPCGSNTDCRVINHSPICTCQNRYTGDPFSRCYIITGKLSS